MLSCCQASPTHGEAIAELRGSAIETFGRDPNECGERLVVLGHGPVAQFFLEAFAEEQKKTPTSHPVSITVIGEEPRPAYNRVQMTQFFEHRDPKQLAMTTEGDMKAAGVDLKVGCKATKINRTAKKVTFTSSNGDSSEVSYDTLVIATGSYPFVPMIKGMSSVEAVNGVFVYRTIEDMQGMCDYAAKCSPKAAVIGGGLLGLEAAKAIKELKMETHVLEVAPFLMPMQLDAEAGSALRAQIEEMGINVHCCVKIQEMVVNKGVLTGVKIQEGETVATLPIEMLVVSAGIRPRDELARECDLVVGDRGGVKVDCYMQSSDPSVFAIGEVASFDGMCYGLIAPGVDQARVLAHNLVSTKELSKYAGSNLSTKLKLMGVDVASFGSSHQFWMKKMYNEDSAIKKEQKLIFIKQEDQLSKLYRKFVLSTDGSQLLGGICVGDTSDYAALMNLCQKGMGKTTPSDLFVGRGGKPMDLDVSQIADADVVCTCHGVTKKEVVDAVNDGCETIPALKAKTKCGSGCGGCVLSTGSVKKIFNTAMKAKGCSVFTGICIHFPFSRREIFDIVKIKRLKSFDEVISTAGGPDADGFGCEVCKPAVASILSTLWNEHVMGEEHHKLQDTNDYVLANIQRSGQYSVVPRVPGGEITPNEMLLLATVAKKYKLWSKITGAQRIGLFGANIWELPSIFTDIVTGTVDGKELCPGGMESGQAYGKALRNVKSCVGTSWCRFGQQDAVATAVNVENRYKGLRAPHKFKMGVSGCIRECAEARGKDVGLVAGPTGYNLYVCGNGGASPKHGTLLASGLSEETAMLYIDRFLMYYTATGAPLTRTSKWLEDVEGGIERLKEVIIEDKLGLAKELDDRMSLHVSTYKCEWKHVVETPELHKRFRQFVNVEDKKNGDLSWTDPQSDARPGKQWKITNVDLPTITGPAGVSKYEADSSSWQWVDVGPLSDFPPNMGTPVKVSQSELAVFRVQESWYATQNSCPHKQLSVLSRGLLGTEKGLVKVACPVHKATFNLDTGAGISSNGELNIGVFDVITEGERVLLYLPPAEQLDGALGKGEIRGDLKCGGKCGEVGVKDIEELAIGA
eukprot:GHVN01083234.1.p1 GENE.GHVN01083234.1~~GHVN01083234.1.p1  ORF type:complete len:1084 (+),score=210.29 GHVN01083234.1:658-3909(+)